MPKNHRKNWQFFFRELFYPTKDDEDSRNIISSRLPEDDLTDEGTSIGGAVTIAIEILQTSGPDDLKQVGGGEIIVLSDGHESHSPSVSDKMKLIKFYGVTVNTISLGNSDTNILDILAAETQGSPQYSLVQPEESLVSLTDSFFSQLGQSEGEAVPIKNEQFIINATGSQYFAFSIDSTVGRTISSFTSSIISFQKILYLTLTIVSTRSGYVYSNEFQT